MMSKDHLRFLIVLAIIALCFGIAACATVALVVVR